MTMKYLFALLLIAGAPLFAHDDDEAKDEQKETGSILVHREDDDQDGSDEQKEEGVFLVQDLSEDEDQEEEKAVS